jgi:predicted oxidoreductase
MGAWRWDVLTPDQIQTLINTSLNAGITTFDHADIYGLYRCEALFGEALKPQPGLRDKIELVTKFGIKLISDRRPTHRIKHYDTTKDHAIQSVENSLQALRTDRIDVLLIHRPDPLLNPADVAETFTQLKQQGKVLHFGVSNFTATQFELLQSYLPFPLVTNQIELSLYKHEALFDGSTDVLQKHRVRPMAWSPLGGGRFFENQQINVVLTQLSEKYQATTTQLLLAWLLKHPTGICPVIGTTKAERIVELAKAMSIELEMQDWFALLKAATGHDVA